MTRLYRLHKLLWDLRHDPDFAAHFKLDPARAAADRDLPPDQLEALVHSRLQELYRLNLNPYLLYFGALESGIGRDAYYKALRHPAEEL